MRKSKITIIALSAIAAVLFVARLLLVDVLRVPTESACPKAGSLVLVGRWSYGYRLPWDAHSRLAYAPARRGDWALYNHPVAARGQQADTTAVSIGCLTAQPGDTLWYNNENGKLSARRGRASGFVHPLVIPAKGARVRITDANIRFYAITIMLHEPVKASIIDGALCVSGKMVTHYVFQQDYYWIQSDNDDDDDSRTFGFVPHASLIGKIL